MFKYLPILGLIFALMLAGALRLGYPGVNAFAFDEARLSLLALATASGDPPTVGMTSSAGVPNMPAAAWVFAPAYVLITDPLFPTLWVGVLGMAAVGGVWWLAWRWGALAATVAASFLAAHPFAVLYGRSVWAQNLLIPLAVLWLLCAYYAAHPTAPRRIAIGVAVFLSGFAAQVHFAGVALALAGGYAFLRWRWYRAPLAVGIGMGAAVLCALPFLLTPGAVGGVLGAAGDGGTVDLAAWRDLLRLAAGWDTAYLLAGDADLPLSRLTPAAMNTGLGVLLALGLALAGTFGAAAWGGLEPPPPAAASPAAPRRAVPALAELSLVLLLAAPLAFTRHSTPVFVHYLLPSLPGLAVLVGWACADARPRALRRGMVALVCVAALVWAGGTVRGLAYAGVHHTPNGLPEPLRTLRGAAYTTPYERPVLYFTHGDDPTTQGEPAIFRALWWPRGDAARILDGRSVLVLPNRPATLMFTERAFQAWEEAHESGLLVGLEQVPRREGAPPFERVAYDGRTPPAGFTLLDTPLVFANGAVLRGWRVYQVGPRTRVSTLWDAPGPLSAELQAFHHLRPPGTPADTPPTVGADVSVRGHTWRAGDTVIVMGDFIDLDPTAAFTLDVGLYTLSDVARVPLMNGGDSVRLGLLPAG